MAQQERAELADLLAAARPEQWNSPSLCPGWRVHEVAAHVISSEEHGGADLIKRLAKARLRLGRLNEVALAQYGHQDPQALVAFLRTHTKPRGITAQRAGGVGLVDALIHHQDIRRPLGMPGQIPVERLSYASPFAVTAPPLRGFWHARGVRLIATDIDWSRGHGLEARGNAETVLMVLAGRRSVAGELTGPGAAIVQQRLG